MRPLPQLDPQQQRRGSRRVVGGPQPGHPLGRLGGGGLSYGDQDTMETKSSLLLAGSPHSSHSSTVSGIVGSDMVVTTSTNGTSATTARHIRGAREYTAPCSR